MKARLVNEAKPVNRLAYNVGWARKPLSLFLPLIFFSLFLSCKGEAFSSYIEGEEAQDAGDSGVNDGAVDDGGDTGEDGGEQIPAYIISLNPDYGRINQQVLLDVSFPDEAPIDKSEDAGVFIAGRPDFGQGVFVRSWKWEAPLIKLTLYIDSTAPTGRHEVSLLVENSRQMVLGKGEFYVLPALDQE